MFNMAMLNSGFSIDEPTDLTTPLEKLIRVGFGIERDAAVEEIEIVLEEEDDEPEMEVEDMPEMIFDQDMGSINAEVFQEEM